MGDLSRNFSKHEFACKCGCGLNTPKQELVNRLEKARYYAGRVLGRTVSFVISSGCRCEDHNEEVGGTKTSEHLTGEAADIAVDSSEERFAILYGLIMAGFVRIGVADDFIHAGISIAAVHPQNMVWTY